MTNFSRPKLLTVTLVVCESKQTLEHLFVECQHVHSFWNLFTSWWNDNNSPSVSLTDNDKIYGYLPENRSFHTFNLCLIVARFYIYTAAKESESHSFLAFKAFLKCNLYTEPSSVRESLSLKPQPSLTCSVISVIGLFFYYYYLCI